MTSYIAKKRSFIDGRFYEIGDPVEYDGPAGANLEPVSGAAARIAAEPVPDRTGLDPVAVARAPGTATGGDAELSAEASAMLDDTVENDDDELVAGNLTEIVPTLGEKTDEELDALEAAENDREKPRSGLLTAIAKERDARV